VGGREKTSGGERGSFLKKKKTNWKIYGEGKREEVLLYPEKKRTRTTELGKKERKGKLLDS